jgi:hypothetical protein
MNPSCHFKMVTNDSTYFESQPNSSNADGFKWLNTYHFLFMDDKKRPQNYSEQELIFQLEHVTLHKMATILDAEK